MLMMDDGLLRVGGRPVDVDERGCGLFSKRLTAAVIKATKISWQLKQAAALGVATLQSSATKTAASTYYFTASLLHMHSLVRDVSIFLRGYLLVVT